MNLYCSCGYVAYGGNLPVPCPQCGHLAEWKSWPHGPTSRADLALAEAKGRQWAIDTLRAGDSMWEGTLDNAADYLAVFDRAEAMATEEATHAD